MSDSEETPGSSPPPTPDNDSSSPPPDNDSSSPPSPAVQDLSPPQDGGSTGNSSSAPPPSDQGGSSPPSPSSSSTPPPPPPPVSNSSPPNSSSPSPPTASPPPPSSSSSKAPQSSPTSPPPPPHSPPPPSPSQQQTPPSSGQSPSPPPPQSPPPSATPVGGTTPSPPPPTELRPPPPLSASTAPPNLSNNVTTSTSNGTSSSSTHGSSSSGGSSSGSSSSGGTGSEAFHSPSRNDSDGGGSASASTATKAVVGVVASVVLIMVIALFFIVRRRRGKKRNSLFPPHLAPPNNFMVKTDGYYGLQHQSMGSPGPPNHSCGSQPQHSPLGNSYGGLDSGLLGRSKTYYSYEEVTEMTDGFAKQNIVGEGGFGYVYKGRLPDGRVVAVKQLKEGSGQGDREFKAEVEIISRVHHKHLVSLVGYCISDRQRMLIYEFVQNKTLEHHLHAKEVLVLDWEKRMKIAIGSAKGLAYLHDDCNPKIIHRDIKSANILLDDAFEAQVADFGLARLNDTTQTHVSTRVMGTFGYLAPEYASSGKLTDRSDVYSFGVVLLELITGRKPVDPTQPLGDESLVEWARPLLIHALDTGDIGELIDPRLEKHYVESEMFRMIETAAACVRHSAPKRPRMVQVVRALDSDTQLSDLSNGVKYGQSTIYDSGQYNQEMMRFRRMALGSTDSSDMDYTSGEYTSRDVSRGPLTPSSDYTSGESETRVLNPSSGNHRFDGLP